jgi:phosphoglycolate phosphatase
MARSGSLKLAVFDLDGTLIDSASSIVTGVLACWAACGFPDPDPVDVRRVIGLPWEESIFTLLPAGAGEPELAMIRNYHDEVARGVRQRPARSEELFPGAVNLLDTLEESGYLLAIITSRASRRLEEILEVQDLSKRFISLKTTDQGPGKPSPELMFQTLSETGAGAKDAVMVGDTTFDILMARNAGTASVGVSWGVHEVDELHQAGADRVVTAFDEIPAVVDGLIGGSDGGPGR